MPPGSVGIGLSFCLSERAEVWLLFLRGDVVTFLGLSHFPRVLHLSGELLQFLYQTLVGDTECLHLVSAIVYSFQCSGRRSAICVALLVLHSQGIGVAPARVPSGYHQSLRDQFYL